MSLTLDALTNNLLTLGPTVELRCRDATSSAELSPSRSYVRLGKQLL